MNIKRTNLQEQANEPKERDNNLVVCLVFQALNRKPNCVAICTNTILIHLYVFSFISFLAAGNLYSSRLALFVFLARTPSILQSTQGLAGPLDSRSKSAGLADRARLY